MAMELFLQTSQGQVVEQVSYILKEMVQGDGGEYVPDCE